MRHIALLAALLLGATLLAAQTVVPTGREGYFWRLAGESNSFNNWNEPGPDDSGGQQITYYYNQNQPSQLDSTVTTGWHNWGGSYRHLSIFTRTDLVDYYQIEEAWFSFYMGIQQFEGLTRRYYNWQNQLYMVQEFTSTLFYSGKYEYDYDAAGNQIAERVFGLRDGVMSLVWEDLHTYDAAGHVTHRHLNVWSDFTDAIVTSRVEDYYFGAYSQPDSIVYQYYALSPDSEYQTVIVHKYNTFDANGNAVSRLDLLTAVPESGANDYFEGHASTQYVSGGQNWYPTWELTHGSYVYEGYGNNLYVTADSTLTTYTYSDDFRHIVRNHQYYFLYYSDTSTTQYNTAGLMTSLSTTCFQDSYGGSTNHTWNWEYVEEGSPNPPTPPVVTSLTCAPNPFWQSLELRLKADSGQYRIQVYNLRGQLVRVLASGTKGAQDLVMVWDGIGGSGTPVPSGIYIIRAHTASGIVSTRVSLIH